MRTHQIVGGRKQLNRAMQLKMAAMTMTYSDDLLTRLRKMHSSVVIVLRVIIGEYDMARMSVL